MCAYLLPTTEQEKERGANPVVRFLFRSPFCFSFSVFCFLVCSLVSLGPISLSHVFAYAILHRSSQPSPFSWPKILQFRMGPCPPRVPLRDYLTI